LRGTPQHSHQTSDDQLTGVERTQRVNGNSNDGSDAEFRRNAGLKLFIVEDALRS
jgi:hypothetical protein